MKGKRHTTEERIRMLRKADTGTSVQALCRESQISEQTFYRWKKEPSGARSTGPQCHPARRSQFGMLEVNPAKRLKELEKEWSTATSADRRSARRAKRS